MKLNKKVEHTTIRDQKLFCLNCGGSYPLIFPMPIDETLSLGKKIEAFIILHEDCKPEWRDIEADQLLSIIEKAMWWINNGQVGHSSKTMWNCLIGNKNFPVYHPYDHDDFSRCYKLLVAVPEWQSQLHKLKSLSKTWSNIVDNWDMLTEMYETNDWNTYTFKTAIMGFYE